MTYHPPKLVTRAIAKIKTLFTQENFFFLGVFVLYLSSAFHEQYPDEYDNMLGGKLILQGVFPYVGYMAHHGPMAYFIAAIIQLFSGFSIVGFRVIYALLLVLLLRYIYSLFTNRFGKASYVKIFAIISGISLMYFWFQMMLGDTLAAFLLLLPYGYLLHMQIQDKAPTKKDLGLVNLFLFMALLTSVSYSFLIVICYAMLGWQYLKHNKIGSIKELLKLAWIIALPYIFFLVYLLLTRSLKDYIFFNFTYNKDFYISDYPKGPDGSPVSILRYAVILAQKTLQTVLGNIPQVLRFNLYDTKTVALLGMDVFLFIYLLIIGRPLASLLVLSMVLYGNARVLNVEVSETGYQQAVYILLSMFNGALLLGQATSEKRDHTYKAFLIGALAIGNIFYVAMYSTFMFQSYTNRVYAKYMGTMSLIYDRPEMAPTINRLLGKDDYAWIGPFAFEEIYYTHTKLPSRYSWILPASAKSDKIVSEMMADFNKNKPKLIIFNPGFSAFGADAMTFTYMIRDFLKENYTLMREVSYDNSAYECTVQTIRNFDCNSFLYIRNDEIGTIIPKMLDLGMAKRK